MDGLFQTKKWWSWCTNFTKEMVSDNYQNWIEAHLMKETSVTSFIHWSTTLGIQSNIRRLVTKTKVIFFRVNQKQPMKMKKGDQNINIKYCKWHLRMQSHYYFQTEKILLTLLGVFVVWKHPPVILKRMWHMKNRIASCTCLWLKREKLWHLKHSKRQIISCCTYSDVFLKGLSLTVQQHLFYKYWKDP